MTKIAVITGTSSGIGQALTLALAARDVFVVAIARKHDALIALKEKFPDKIHTICADLTSKNGLEKITSEVKQFTIDYLINNAGIITPLGLLHTSSQDEIRLNIETNVLAPLFLTQNLLPFFNKQEGRILNITSVAGDQAVSGAGAYCISKAANNMWSQVLKTELPKHILVAEVIPGEVNTNMQKHLREVPIEKFPLAAEFQHAYQQNTLISPETCADFLADILINTATQDFPHKRWNIYKDYNKPLPQPLNKDKLADQ